MGLVEKRGLGSERPQPHPNPIGPYLRSIAEALGKLREQAPEFQRIDLLECLGFMAR